jgi:hypothetical protein
MPPEKIGGGGLPSDLRGRGFGTHLGHSTSYHFEALASRLSTVACSQIAILLS